MRLLVWASVFVCITSISYMVMNPSEIGLEVVIKYAEAIAIMCIVLVVVQDKETLHAAKMGVLVATVIAVAMNWVDYLQPHLIRKVELSTVVEGRAAGAYLNSNIAGQILVLGMIASISVVPRRWRIYFCLVVATGVLVTFSRSSITMWALAMCGLAYCEMFVLRRWASVGLVSALILVAAVTLVTGRWVGVFTSVVGEERLNANTLSRIGGNFFEQTDESAVLRREVARRGFQLYVKAPLFGYGVGATEEGATRVSSHNLYARLGVEFGTAGLLMLGWLLWLVWKSGAAEGKVFGGLFAISNIFSHNNLEQSGFLILLAICALGYLATSGNGSGAVNVPRSATARFSPI